MGEQDTYGLTEWLAHTWATVVDERLEAMVVNMYDLGERVQHLARVVTVALCTVAAIAAVLLGAVLWWR